MSGKTKDDAPQAGFAAGGGAEKPLRTCVREALERYFAQLDGHECQGLFDLVMGEVEAPLLEAVLAHTKGNQTRAAQMLGINRATLRKKLRQYRIE
ncbi:MAG: DNA-binding transcriptional regulator Fis [Ectothiorhodospiraceae bacterium]|nr:DNA-binding transcriptional regulator Fis [Chromatiales bacterium]MCP5157018.1 DNA-binding transcriptional regulator Fis [Ectothiorhodospiraceae bacterium]